MSISDPHTPPPVYSHARLWHQWRGYAARWLVFGEVVEIYQPVVGQSHLWQQKLMQALVGLLFGAVCALFFTVSQNVANFQRRWWKTFIILLTSWLLTKLLFLAALAMVD